MRIKEAIKYLVSTNNYSKSLNILKQQVEGDDKLEQQYAIVSGAFHQLQEDLQTQTIDSRDSRLQRAQIGKSILNLSQRLPSDEIYSTGSFDEKMGLPIRAFLHRYGNSVLISIGLAVILALLIAYNLETNSYPVSISLSVSKAQFSAKGNINFFKGESVEGLYLQHFQELFIPAQKVSVSSAPSEPLTSLKIQENRCILTPEFEDADVFLHEVDLQEFYVKGPARISITLPDLPDQDVSPQFSYNMYFDTHSQTVGKVTYQDSLRFEGNYLSCDWGGEVIPYDFINGYASSVGRSEIISIKAQKSPFKLNLYCEDSVVIGAQEFMVDSLRFTKRVEAGKAVSSLQHADIKFLDKKGKPFQTIRVEDSYYLSITPQTDFQVSKLSVFPENISLSIHGIATNIESGISATDMKSLNISILEKIINQHFPQLLTLLFLILVISTVIYLSSRSPLR